MLPFSVLRVWGTGLFSWAILALGVYCLWQWHDLRQALPDVAPLPAVNERELPPVEIEARREARQERDQRLHRARIFLTSGIVLLAFSGFGFLPVGLLLGKPGGGPRSERGGEATVIERPDGARLHMEAYGPRGGLTLVFTHGWSLDSTAWYYVREALSKRFRVITWDLRGLGKSRGPADDNYEIERMADDLGAVLQNAGQGPFILVGHSIGGMITQTFCRLMPGQLGSRVVGIALVHTTFTDPVKTAIAAKLLRAIETPILVPLNYLTIVLAPLVWLSNWQSYLNGTMQAITRFSSFSGRQTWGQVNYGALLAAKAWPAVVARGNLAMTRFEEEAALRDIDIPALVIAGQYDRMTRPGAGHRIAEELPREALFTIRSGHLGIWEQHQEVAALITEFAERFADSGAAPTSGPQAKSREADAAWRHPSPAGREVSGTAPTGPPGDVG
jgi:pimeloyl-ACP methyl ester carboxylesterase